MDLFTHALLVRSALVLLVTALEQPILRHAQVAKLISLVLLAPLELTERNRALANFYVEFVVMEELITNVPLVSVRMVLLVMELVQLILKLALPAKTEVPPMPVLEVSLRLVPLALELALVIAKRVKNALSVEPFISVLMLVPEPLVLALEPPIPKLVQLRQCVRHTDVKKPKLGPPAPISVLPVARVNAHHLSVLLVALILVLSL